jgi:MFS family permease
MASTQQQPPPAVVSSFVEDNEKVVDSEHVEDIARSNRAIVPEHEGYSIPKTARVFWRCTLFAVGMSLAAAFECFALIVPNSIVANQGFIRDFGRVYGPDGVPIAMKPSDLSNWNLAVSLGGVVGLPIGGFFSDRFGRKVVLMACTANLTLAVILSVTIRPSFGGWLARALVSGLSQGLLQSSLIPYLSEIAPSKIRGMYLSMYSFFWGLGILVGSIALYVSEQIDPDNWKGPFYAQFVFLGMFIPALVFAPETPWFLARKGQEAKAKRALRTLYGNVSTYDVDRELPPSRPRNRCSRMEQTRRDQNGANTSTVSREPTCAERSLAPCRSSLRLSPASCSFMATPSTFSSKRATPSRSKPTSYLVSASWPAWVSPFSPSTISAVDRCSSSVLGSVRSAVGRLVASPLWKLPPVLPWLLSRASGSSSIRPRWVPSVTTTLVKSLLSVSSPRRPPSHSPAT